EIHGGETMNNFGYTRASDVADAVRQIADDPGAKFIAGGTNLIDLMKENVARPSRLIDITHLPLNKIEETRDGGLRIGALVPNSDLAYHPRIEARYPLLSSAILAGASQQLRNMASTGGNLLQRTRCFYFYDTTTPCNKREPGSGCSAIEGINRMHAILGTSEHCIATHPSDMCVALAALDARVLATGKDGQRSIAFAEFHRLPGDTPQIDSNLRADEIITAIELPPKGFADNYTYLKIRDRLSYAFALVSVAVGLEIEGDTVKEAVWRSAASRTSRGATVKPKRSSMERRRRAKTSCMRRICAARRARLRPQRLQDRAGAPRHPARADPGGAENSAVASGQANQVSGESAMTATSYLGKPTSRIDGHAKVTGTAKYAAEYNVPGLAHGFVVSSAIAKGRIRRIHTADALAVDGVIDVFTHEHRPKLASSHEKYTDEVAPPGSPFCPVYEDKILFSGQPVALVVAEEFEIARFAASLIRVEYERKPQVTDFEAQRKRGAVSKRDPSHSIARGNPAPAFEQAPVRIKAEYRMPVEHHNPMEPFAATAVWEGNGHITVFDKTQGPQNCRNYVAGVFGMPRDKVRVLSAYVGGGFGSGLRPQYELPLAVLAARALKRSVRVTLTRQQMFTLGYRAANVHEMMLAADQDGSLASFRHEAVSMTSQFEDFQRDLVNWSSLLYRCANSELGQRLVKLDQNPPCDMRAPGGAEAAYAIECAMDELAYAANIDPLELRLINYSDKDQIEDRRYSSKELRECYRQGAEKF